MTIALAVVDHSNMNHVYELYALLSERTPQQSISHKEMPSFADHCKFVQSNPYKVWYLIRCPDLRGGVVGSIYLTKANEVGIAIFKDYRGRGYGKEALQEILKLPRTGPILANINPANVSSVAFFKAMGFTKQLQVTYVHE